MAKIRSFAQLRARYTWDEISLRYRSRSGRFVAQSEIKRATLSLARASEHEIRSLAQQLADGRIALDEWQSRMVQNLKNLHLSQASVAKGGASQMTQADFGRVGRTLRFQYERLRRFALEIEAGIVSPGAIEARAAMYARSGNSTYEEFRRFAASDAGFDEERRRLGPAEHCSDCVAFARLGWQPIGSLPRIGDSICLVNCKCTFEFRRASRS